MEVLSTIHDTVLGILIFWIRSRWAYDSVSTEMYWKNQPRKIHRQIQTVGMFSLSGDLWAKNLECIAKHGFEVWSICPRRWFVIVFTSCNTEKPTKYSANYWPTMRYQPSLASKYDIPIRFWKRCMGRSRFWFSRNFHAQLLWMVLVEIGGETPLISTKIMEM